MFIHIVFAEAEVEEHLKDVAGKEGQTCTLTCQFSVPNVKTQWFRNGKRLEAHGRYAFAVAGYTQKLSIKDVKPEDQGEYTCKYNNLETTANLWVEGVYVFTQTYLHFNLNHLLTSSTIIFDSSSSYEELKTLPFKNTCKILSSHGILLIELTHTMQINSLTQRLKLFPTSTI